MCLRNLLSHTNILFNSGKFNFKNQTPLHINIITCINNNISKLKSYWDNKIQNPGTLTISSILLRMDGFHVPHPLNC